MKMGSQSLSDKENWLIRFLTVQKASDAQVAALLQASLDDLDKHLKRIEAKPGVGAAVRRAQLLGNRGAVTLVLSSLYKRLGDVVREGQANAAQAATEAELIDASKIYDEIIEDPVKRDILKRSLEQTARRNIQVTVTRMTDSQQPLSKRLYKSQVISKGQVSKVVSNHLAKGSSAAEMAKDLRAFFDPKVPGGVSFRARTLARTEINNAFHAQAAADMSDRPWVNQCRWHLSGSHKIPDECNTYASTGLFPVDNIPKKPHPNCFSGEALVSAISVNAVTRRRYDGRFVDVFTTEDSPQLSGTPNHPALTRRGWVALSELREGDELVVYSGSVPAVVDTPGDKNIPVRIENVFESFLVTGGVTTSSVPSSSEQFHGDGSLDGDVDIVWSNGLLKSGREAEEILNSSLFGGYTDLPNLSGISPLASFFPASDSASNSFMGGGSHGGDFLGTVQTGSFGSGSEGFVEPVQHSSYLHTTEADDPAGLIERLSGSINFARVSSVVDRPGGFTGHVYNLSTNEGWYLANSIAVKNCLCWISPDLPDVETVINDYLAGKYNSWLSEHTDDGLRRSA